MTCRQTSAPPPLIPKAEELLLTWPRPSPPRRAPQAYLSQQVEVIRAIHDQLMAHPTGGSPLRPWPGALYEHLHLKVGVQGGGGQPIAAHMKHHRMEEAARLLQETDGSIGDIAQQVGL